MPLIYARSSGIRSSWVDAGYSRHLSVYGGEVDLVVEHNSEAWSLCYRASARAMEAALLVPQNNCKRATGCRPMS